MTFTLLPAVDVASGRAIRPDQGQADGETASGATSNLDARGAALRWQAEGAEWIHLVDLDAAFGRGSNAELLAAVIGELDVRVELSGGIADDVLLQRALATGCDRVILATQALLDIEWCAAAIVAHGERIAVALDVRIDWSADGSTEHRLAARGSTDDGGDLWQVLQQLDAAGCARYIVTDVTRDGMLSGPNLELYRSVAAFTPARVIASGGISSIADLVTLAEIAQMAPNLEGSIVGKALYADRFTLHDALAATGSAGAG